MNRLAKHIEFFFMQEEVRAYTPKLSLEILKDEKQLQSLEPHHWPLNCPESNPVDFGIWELLEQNVYRGRRITDLDSSKEPIVEE